SPLVGRGDQLADLKKELAGASNGSGGIIGIVGEAGIGKSRLCFEFTEHCRQGGIRVYETRVLEHGTATPLQPVLELLRDLFGIRENEDHSVSRQRVVERTSALPEQLRLLLLEFLGLGDTTSLKLDPKARKQQ